MLEFLFNYSLGGIILINSLVTLTIFLVAVPAMQKRTVKGIFKRMNGQKGGKLAVDGKIDKAILTRAVADILSPENPSGAVLQFFTSVSSYLKTNPQSVVGFIRLLDNMGNLANIKETMSQLNKNPKDINNPNYDYSKYR